ncbi:hypothetical protein PHLGIDRAFT_262262 [Phlebiopsis gigantea 11061_1 CR5-6]|uniref:Uncharacterized protein n=1 Tax=Phlebiopsis gigantea (strain 11061_1 CR5-6) TaxID=745531 RepID=A0A0C3P3R0_PHLG1|nr:hypothetical protein PHLGIDRAFT_262262 [Phlebiopsis gigantea 11061_1 CR5-6]
MTSAVEEVTNDELLTISKHRSEAALHGAAQLPHSLSDVVGVVHSDYASPAAVRLTLRLLYAVYITGPHLGNVDVWTSDGPEPVVLLQALHAYIHKPHASSNDETKVADAMAVALFAAVDSARGRTEASPFRPHTQATLLKMISATLPSPCETFTALVPVTRPQLWLAALFAAGHTVQWCWRAWCDERIVGYDTILSLTTTWLYHLSQEDHCVFPTTRHWHSTFSTAISVDPSAAAVAISALLRLMKQSLTSSQHATPDEILDVVMKCCQGASWLLAASKDGQSSTDLSRRFSDSLCGLFFLLPDGCIALDIKDIIIEGLSYASHDVLADSLAELSGASGFDVASRLDDSIHAICR